MRTNTYQSSFLTSPASFKAMPSLLRTKLKNTAEIHTEYNAVLYPLTNPPIEWLRSYPVPNSRHQRTEVSQRINNIRAAFKTKWSTRNAPLPFYYLINWPRSCFIANEYSPPEQFPHLSGGVQCGGSIAEQTEISPKNILQNMKRDTTQCNITLTSPY